LINPRVLIIGASGLLGSALVNFLKMDGFKTKSVSRISRTDYNADFTSISETQKTISDYKPDFVINLVALTSVEECERDIQKAYLLNTKVVENITEVLAKGFPNTNFIQISTDHVYGSIGPHKENLIELKNIYAFSKFSGEIAARNIPSMILRTNFVGRSSVIGRESMSDWVVNSLQNQKKIKVFDDVYFSPITINRLCQIISHLIKSPIPGTYNLGCHDGLSKADFDLKLAQRLNLDVRLMDRISENDASFLQATRPKDMRMDCSLFERTFSILLPTMDEIINDLVSEYDDS
jgi:dTDP-4-dehydrorhamnose reductase